MNPTHKLIEAAQAAIGVLHATGAQAEANALREAVDGLREAGEPVAFDEAACRAKCDICNGPEQWPCAKKIAMGRFAAPPSPAPQPAQDGASK